jgi:adenine deaminase
LNTAEHFGVAREVGQIAPGRFADLLLVENLEAFEVGTVIARGEIVAKDGELQIDLPEFSYPDEVMSSINLGKTLQPEDFRITTALEGEVEVNVIGVVENQAPTQHLCIKALIEDGEVRADPSIDLAKVALVERHRGTGEVQVGFVQGFGFETGCAVGSTVAHDSHHMIVVGTSDSDMATAANKLGELGGGQIVVQDGAVVAQVELPIAGLMSNENAQVVATKAEKLLEAFETVGCKLNNANMQLSLLALVVIPDLRISDMGLVEVNTLSVIPLLKE